MGYLTKGIIVLLLVLLVFSYKEHILNFINKNTDNIGLKSEASQTHSVAKTSVPTFPLTPIKDISQNHSSYELNNITLSGKLNLRIGGYSLEDGSGYWVWIEDNCLEPQREYTYNSRSYTAKGVWLAPKSKEFRLGMDYNFRLHCVLPLD